MSQQFGRLLRGAAALLAVFAVSGFGAPATLAKDAETGASSSTQTRTLEELRRQVRERIVTAGRQRMLAETMAGKLCFAESGIAPDLNRNRVYVSWNIFSWYHRGIRAGNVQLELDAEQDRKVLAAWRKLDAEWRTLSELYRPTLSGKRVVGTDFKTTIDKTRRVTEEATTLVATIRSAYAKDLGAQGFGSALLIDLYERQRMLGARIAKDVCLISRGDTGQARLEGLTRTIEIFNLSLEAFQNGREDVGVPSPPNRGIAQSLLDAQAHWRPVSAFAYASAIGQQLGPVELGEFSDAMELFNVKMTEAINRLVSHKNQSG